MKVAIKNKSEWKFIDSGDIEVGGFLLKELFEQTKKQQDVILSLLKQSQNELHLEQEKYNNLISFLSDYLLNVTNNTYEEEKAIREQINSLLVANTEPIDNVLIVDGYIKGVEQCHTLIRPIEVPQDIAYGYWKLVNGQFELDKEKFNQLWSMV